MGLDIKFFFTGAPLVESMVFSVEAPAVHGEFCKY